MPTSPRLILALLAAFALATAGAIANQTFQLTEEEAATLNEEALEYYEKGLDEINHILYQEALESFTRATEADPTNVDLRFLVAKLAISEARKEGGNSSVRLLNRAEDHLNKIVALKGETARRADVQEAESKLNMVIALRKSQDDQDARKERIGKQVLSEWFMEIYKRPLGSEAEDAAAAQEGGA